MVKKKIMYLNRKDFEWYIKKYFIFSQFLPQDRVSEFAELSPSQLLERTQAATGEIELHDMQKKLMEWRNKEKDLEKVRNGLVLKEREREFEY